MKMKRNESVRKDGFTKKDHVKYWVDTANKDWRAIKLMLECKTYVHALFFMHLLLEKLLKAHWVKDNPGNHPPKIHDLVKLAEQTSFKMSKEQIQHLRDMNNFQLEGRYPGYKQNLYRIYKEKKTNIIFNLVNSLRKCLIKELQ